MRALFSRDRNHGRLLPVAARDRHTVRVLYRFHAERGYNIRPLRHPARPLRHPDVLLAGESVVLFDNGPGGGGAKVHAILPRPGLRHRAGDSGLSGWFRE